MRVSGLKTRKMVMVRKIYQTEDNLTQVNSKIVSVMVTESILMPMVHLMKVYSKMAFSGKVKVLKSMKTEIPILVNSKMEKSMV